MNKQQLLSLAQRIVDERRYKAEEKALFALDELRKNDQWAQLEQKLRSAQVELAMGSENDELQSQVVALKTQQAQLLKSLSKDADALVPHYFCAKCRDTGYVDGKRCSCLQTELRKLLFAESHVPDSAFTFENSQERNKHNKAVYKTAEKLCDSGELNLLLIGNVGTGKTYLLTSCANRMIQKGKNVLFVTAFALNNSLLAAQRESVDDLQTVLDTLVEVDLLCIDDLGAEKIYKNFSAECLFALLNERIVNKKQTFISTNLTLADIRERYDERIFSRLVDGNSTVVAQLLGNDKRVTSK